MMFPFAITNQQENLKKRFYDLVQRKAKVPSAKGVAAGPLLIFGQVNDACLLFKSATETTRGLIKSFIPFTAAFSYRMTCAKRINEASKLLNKIEREIKVAEKEKAKQEKISNSNGILKRSRTVSPERSPNASPETFHSPIKKKVRVEKKNEEEKANTTPPAPSPIMRLFKI